MRATPPDGAVVLAITGDEEGDAIDGTVALLDWMDEAQLDRVGCFQYENVEGARSNALPDHVPEDVKQDRWNRFMEKAQEISQAKLDAKLVPGGFIALRRCRMTNYRSVFWPEHKKGGVSCKTS